MASVCWNYWFRRQIGHPAQKCSNYASKLPLFYLPEMNNEKDSQTKLNKSVISLLRRLSTWRCLHLLLSIGPTVIDWYLLQTPTRRSAAANPPATCCCRMMRQTDGRTIDRYTDPAPHTTRALSKSCIMIYFLSYTMGFSHKSIVLTKAEADHSKTSRWIITWLPLYWDIIQTRRTTQWQTDGVAASNEYRYLCSM